MKTIQSIYAQEGCIVIVFISAAGPLSMQYMQNIFHFFQSVTDLALRSNQLHMNSENAHQ